MERWRLFGVALSAVGVVDAIYLLVDSLYPAVALVCPSSGAINCSLVTSSSFSKFAGVPVAALGVAFFVAMFGILVINDPTINYLLLPIWAIGMIFAGYLVYAELFVLHAICPYCTLAHVCALLLGIPAIKLALGDES